MPEWWSNLDGLSGFTGPTVYLVVFALVLIESGIVFGFLLPGDTVLFAAGLISAEAGSGIDTATMAAVVVVAAVLGDLIGYESGRRFGRPWLARHTTVERLARAEEVTLQWGAPAVVICRFIPWLRTFVPILAGIGRMQFASFMTANLAGALIWGAGLVVIGRLAAFNETIKLVAYAIAGTAIAFAVLAPVVATLRRRWTARRS